MKPTRFILLLGVSFNWPWHSLLGTIYQAKDASMTIKCTSVMGQAIRTNIMRDGVVFIPHSLSVLLDLRYNHTWYGPFRGLCFLATVGHSDMEPLQPHQCSFMWGSTSCCCKEGLTALLPYCRTWRWSLVGCCPPIESGQREPISPESSWSASAPPGHHLHPERGSSRDTITNPPSPTLLS